MLQRSPLNLHVETLNLTINGTPPEASAMRDTFRVIGSDRAQEPPPDTVGELAGLAERIVSELLARIPQTLPIPSLDTRSLTPGVWQTPTAAAPIDTPTLPELFDLFQARTDDDKTPQSWSSFRTLIRYWRNHHGDDGPPSHEITTDTLSTFFRNVAAWQTRRSWEKYRDCVCQILNSACPATIDNPGGMPAAASILQRDTLPVWRIPKPRWFRDRNQTNPDNPQRIGGHKKRNIPLLSVDEFGALLTACDYSEYMRPIWWKTWLSLLWFNGPRFHDSLAYRYDCGPLHIDTEHRILDFTESKCGGATAVPIPSFLADLFAELRTSQGNPPANSTALTAQPGSRHYYSADTPPEYSLPRGDLTNQTRRLKPEWCRLFALAGVPLRHPHEMREVAVSNWFKHAPKYRFAAIGHKPPKSDTQLRNYNILDDDFRAAADAYPYPADT